MDEMIEFRNELNELRSTVVSLQEMNAHVPLPVPPRPQVQDVSHGSRPGDLARRMIHVPRLNIVPPTPIHEQSYQQPFTDEDIFFLPPLPDTPASDDTFFGDEGNYHDASPSPVPDDFRVEPQLIEDPVPFDISSARRRTGYVPMEQMGRMEVDDEDDEDEHENENDEVREAGIDYEGDENEDEGHSGVAFQTFSRPSSPSSSLDSYDTAIDTFSSPLILPQPAAALGVLRQDQDQDQDDAATDVVDGDEESVARMESSMMSLSTSSITLLRTPQEPARGDYAMAPSLGRGSEYLQTRLHELLGDEGVGSLRKVEGGRAAAGVGGLGLGGGRGKELSDPGVTSAVRVSMMTPNLLDSKGFPNSFPSTRRKSSSNLKSLAMDYDPTTGVNSDTSTTPMHVVRPSRIPVSTSTFHRPSYPYPYLSGSPQLQAFDPAMLAQHLVDEMKQCLVEVIARVFMHVVADFGHGGGGSNAGVDLDLGVGHGLGLGLGASVNGVHGLAAPTVLGMGGSPHGHGYGYGLPVAELDRETLSEFGGSVRTDASGGVGVAGVEGSPHSVGW